MLTCGLNPECTRRLALCERESGQSELLWTQWPNMASEVGKCFVWEEEACYEGMDSEDIPMIHIYKGIVRCMLKSCFHASPNSQHQEQDWREQYIPETIPHQNHPFNHQNNQSETKMAPATTLHIAVFLPTAGVRK